MALHVTEMWRQLRNAIVHHDGALDRIEERRCKQMWLELSRHLPRELPGQARAPIEGYRISLKGYHVVYWFTNTWATVQALLGALEELEKLALQPKLTAVPRG